jgi:hypothetical protein
MELIVVRATEWHGVLVARLAPERPRLNVFEVVRLRRRAAADETGLSRYEPKMVAVAVPLRLPDRQFAFVDVAIWPSLGLIDIRPRSRWRGTRSRSERRIIVDGSDGRPLAIQLLSRATTGTIRFAACSPV